MTLGPVWDEEEMAAAREAVEKLRRKRQRAAEAKAEAERERQFREAEKVRLHARALSLRKEGMPYREIGARLVLNPSTVRKWCHEVGL